MSVYFADQQVTLHHGDALDVARTLPAGAANCIVTSPPYYGLRDYDEPRQYGLEETPAEYVEVLRALFAELRRVLADDGTLWINLGDSYNAYNHNRGPGGTFRRPADHARNNCGPGLTDPVLPAKNMLGIPWRVAFALQDDGWILRNAIVWNKPNAMPESARDRLSGRYEHVFLFAKSQRYWFDLDPIREARSTLDPADPSYRANGKSDPRAKDHAAPPGQSPQTNMIATGTRHTSAAACGRNPGDVWTMPTQPFPGAHFAVYPIQLPQRCILAGCKPGGTVLDPFSGSGTTGIAAQRAGRSYIGIDLSRKYLALSLADRDRLSNATLDFESSATTTSKGNR